MASSSSSSSSSGVAPGDPAADPAAPPADPADAAPAAPLRPLPRAGGALDVSDRLLFVLKGVQPDLGISVKGAVVVNSFLSDTFEAVATEAARLALERARARQRRTGTGTAEGAPAETAAAEETPVEVTLTARDIHDAVRTLIPGQLGCHAVIEGMKACAKFFAAAGDQVSVKDAQLDNEEEGVETSESEEEDENGTPDEEEEEEEEEEGEEAEKDSRADAHAHAHAADAAEDDPQR